MTRAATTVPFFARYLEGQAYPKVKSNVKAGKGSKRPIFTTLKYPSDHEDGPPQTTLKFPSDNEG